MTSLTLLIQSWAYHSDSTHWQTMVFTVLTLAQLANVLAIRSEKESLFSIGPFSNRSMTVAIIITVILQMATIYIPALNQFSKQNHSIWQNLQYVWVQQVSYLLLLKLRSGWCDENGFIRATPKKSMNKSSCRARFHSLDAKELSSKV
jgi:Ca2+-transporting ATPase